MQGNNKIPRWIVENDPSWEKSIDSNLGVQRWTKKGSGITAVGTANSMFCEILGQDDTSAGLTDIASGFAKMQKESTAGASDITKYLASRYLNPGISGPRLDLRKFRTI